MTVYSGRVAALLLAIVAWPRLAMAGKTKDANCNFAGSMDDIPLGEEKQLLQSRSGALKSLHLAAESSEAAGVGNAGWAVKYGPTNGAAVKSIARSGRFLIGPRASEKVVKGVTLSTVETWASTDEGSSWTMIGLITEAQDTTLRYGDPVVLAVPNSDIIFAAFREHSTIVLDSKESFSIVLCRSDDMGRTWAFDSMITGPFEGVPGVADHFVGAPFLRFDSGMLEVYFDNEPLPNRQGHVHHQWITMLKRQALSKGSAWPQDPKIVSKASDDSLSRDGMATIVDLGNNHLMMVAEMVGPGPSHPNMVGATFSWNGGETWDLSSRKGIYEGKLDATTGKRFNAFCPWAIRVGYGPVWVAFLTDEDFPSPPDASNKNVLERRSSVKYIQTTSSFQTWSDALIISSSSRVNYKPGLFERKLNTVLCTVDTLQNGEQIVMENSR